MRATEEQIKLAKKLGFNYEDYKAGGEYFTRGDQRISEAFSGKYWVTKINVNGHGIDFKNIVNLTEALNRWEN